MSFDPSELAIVRRAYAQQVLAAAGVQNVSRVSVYPCLGAREESAETALAQAIEKGGWEFVKRFHRHGGIGPSRCWLRTETYCFAYD